MSYYGAQRLADSFRTVRGNTILVAESIPAEHYGFTAAPGLRTVAQQLAHIAVQPRWQIRAHTEGLTFIDFERFGRELSRSAAEAAILQSKDEILAALQQDGDELARFIESLDEARLAEVVEFPPPATPSSKSRFELLLNIKEHELHHRAQLMLIQRLLGIVPHLTQRREAMAAQLAQGRA